MLVNKIRELRESLQKQQKDLAIDLVVSQPTISDWESGRKQPSSKSVAKLADYFGVSIDYLLGRIDDSATGEKEKTATKGGLSEEEARLISRLREAPKVVRDTIYRAAGVDTNQEDD